MKKIEDSRENRDAERFGNLARNIYGLSNELPRAARRLFSLHLIKLHVSRPPEHVCSQDVLEKLVLMVRVAAFSILFPLQSPLPDEAHKYCTQDLKGKRQRKILLQMLSQRFKSLCLVEETTFERL